MKLKALICLAVLTTLFSASCGGGGGNADVTYVAMGASDAVGIGATPLTNGYVFRIRGQLEACNGSVELINLGIPGAEIDQLKNIELPVAIQAKPNLVTIWTGANDLVAGASPSDFESTLNSILSDLGTKTSAFVVIGNIPNLAELPRFQEQPDPDVTPARVREFNAAIERQAALFHIPVANLFSMPLGDSLINDMDGFHPNDQGYAAVTQVFLAQIQPQFCPG